MYRGWQHLLRLFRDSFLDEQGVQIEHQWAQTSPQQPGLAGLVLMPERALLASRAGAWEDYCSPLYFCPPPK